MTFISRLCYVVYESRFTCVIMAACFHRGIKNKGLYLTIHSDFFSDLRDINIASYKFYNCEIKSCYFFFFINYFFISLLIISLFSGRNELP